MELYDFKIEKLINPSKLKYVVPITQPACHKMKRIISFKNKNKNNFLNSYSNDNEFENYMKEMKQIKMKNFMTLKKRKGYSLFFFCFIILEFLFFNFIYLNLIFY